MYECHVFTALCTVPYCKWSANKIVCLATCKYSKAFLHRVMTHVAKHVVLFTNVRYNIINYHLGFLVLPVAYNKETSCPTFVLVSVPAGQTTCTSSSCSGVQTCTVRGSGEWDRSLGLWW